MTDPFFEVCEECGRQIAKAGHDPDCPNDDRTRDTDSVRDGGESQ